jgi:hypothetical protein
MEAVAVTVPKVAVMVEVPPEMAVATPALLMVAMVPVEDVQVTDDERSLLVPSL